MVNEKSFQIMSNMVEARSLVMGKYCPGLLVSVGLPGLGLLFLFICRLLVTGRIVLRFFDVMNECFVCSLNANLF